MRLALYQPDIPQNTGTMVRMAACLNVGIDLIEPAGFDLSDRNFRRSGMDYVERALIERHASWEAFCQNRRSAGLRLLLVETDGAIPYTDFAFQPDDVLIMGRETSGVPLHVYEECDATLRINMQPGLRSLNVAIAAAMVLGEALRQNTQF
jgi:tRNA (cytidine/uridine-2'-O-)-methyltransferase